MSIRRLIPAVAVALGCALVFLCPCRPIPEPTSNPSMPSRSRACLLTQTRMRSGWATRRAISCVEGTPRLDDLQHVESITKWSQDASISFITLSARAYCEDMTAKLQQAAQAPAPAQATPGRPSGAQTDEGFLDALQKRPVPIVSDAAAVDLAHSTCALLQRGGTAQEAVSHIGRSDALRHYPNSHDRELKNLQAFTS